VEPDKRHYLVVVDYGPLGVVYVETQVEDTGREDTIGDLIAGQFDNPIKVIAFDPEACDVSNEIAGELAARAWKQQFNLSSGAAI
jgi:hypothetical protein